MEWPTEWSPEAVAVGGLALCITLLLLGFFLLSGEVDKSESDKPFVNGVSYTFLFKVVGSGSSLDAIVKLLSRRIRKRLFVSTKKWVFFGDETWWVGHPAIAAQAFAPKNMKNWRKLTKDETLALFYMSQEDRHRRNAMLYTGDDDGWKHARTGLTPFFYNYDFAEYDEKMDSCVAGHLKSAAQQEHPFELLSMTLKITVDLLCRTLYNCVLPEDELDILTSSLAEYIVPGTSTSKQFPGGLDALQYHTKVATEMGKKAPEGTLAHIILNDIPSMPQELREENLAFFLEALTPAFAAFWTICNILQSIDASSRERAKKDAVFRQQCIKESLRMYPPVPILWPRQALSDQTFKNPLYNPYEGPSSNQGFLSKLFFGTPVEDQPSITIKKGTSVILFPGVYHHDDRFWVRSNEFLPERWDKEPDILAGGNTAQIATRKRMSKFAGLVSKKKDIQKGGRANRAASYLASSSMRKYANQSSVRSQIFGKQHEQLCTEAGIDQLFECTIDDHDSLQAWTFLPFGLGQHACLGRRLAIRMVDSIVSMFLEYDAQFHDGVIPSLLTRKLWHQRTSGTNAAYNAPADPVFIEVKAPPSIKPGVFRSSFITWDTGLDKDGNRAGNSHVESKGLSILKQLAETDWEEEEEEEEEDTFSRLKPRKSSVAVAYHRRSTEALKLSRQSKISP